MELLPAIDPIELQKKATEYAMKGAIESIKEYYTGYNSPFKKAIDAELQKKGIGFGLELPDIIGVLNESFSREIDEIANSAIAQTFIPLVREFLVRAEPQMNFSDILKAFIGAMEVESIDDYDVSVEEHDKFGWLSIRLSCGDKSYSFTLHKEGSEPTNKATKYRALGLPVYDSRNQPSMTLVIEGARIEMPFTRDILKDRFITLIARMVIAKTEVTMDCKEFYEDMFPEKRCHC